MWARRSDGLRDTNIIKSDKMIRHGYQRFVAHSDSNSERSNPRLFPHVFFIFTHFRHGKLRQKAHLSIMLNLNYRLESDLI